MIDPATAGIIGAVVLLLLALLAMAIRQRGSPAPTQAPDVDGAEVWVTGWSENQLDEILRGFAKLYRLSPETFGQRTDRSGWSVVKCGPIASGNLCFLVNYLHYPHDQKSLPGAIDVVAVLSLPRVMGPADAASTLAKIYVPVENDEHDLVYAALPDGRSFVIPFTNLRWKAVDDGQMSARVASVPFD